VSQLDPGNTTAGDICTAALKDCGAFGVGQTPLGEDIQDAQTRLQWMLQQWERKRWFVYHLVTYAHVAEPDPEGQLQGKQVYTVGPGGDFNTNLTFNDFTGEYDSNFGPAHIASARPNRIESAFFRQIQFSGPNQVDYPLTQLDSREDYNRIALKSLSSFPYYFFYSAEFNLGSLYVWPVPQAGIYEVHITIRQQLPPMFATTAEPFDIPYEYYAAMEMNLAIRLRPKYGIKVMQGDMLPGMAKDALNTLRKANFRISRLQMPADLTRPRLYNIFSDRVY
jgi:hypothetical protein